MNRNDKHRSALLLVAALFCSAASTAQVPSIQRSVLARGDVSIADREAVVARVDIASGAAAGAHTHPGDEIGYVLDGELEMTVEGQPLRMLKTGDAFVIQAGKVHNARNIGATVARVVSTYVVEKGKPLATLVQ